MTILPMPWTRLARIGLAAAALFATTPARADSAAMGCKFVVVDGLGATVLEAFDAMAQGVDPNEMVENAPLTCATRGRQVRFCDGARWLKHQWGAAVSDWPNGVVQIVAPIQFPLREITLMLFVRRVDARCAPPQ